ncbi:hypothetical protein K439DRAFT_1532997 [Ramaria rubella]|nr:hypothetical protein K439DRAFT_1532997 [Ramaria rubella]
MPTVITGIRDLNLKNSPRAIASKKARLLRISDFAGIAPQLTRKIPKCEDEEVVTVHLKSKLLGAKNEQRIPLVENNIASARPARHHRTSSSPLSFPDRQHTIVTSSDFSSVFSFSGSNESIENPRDKNKVDHALAPRDRDALSGDCQGSLRTTLCGHSLSSESQPLVQEPDSKNHNHGVSEMYPEQEDRTRAYNISENPISPYSSQDLVNVATIGMSDEWFAMADSLQIHIAQEQQDVKEELSHVLETKKGLDFYFFSSARPSNNSVDMDVLDNDQNTSPSAGAVQLFNTESYRSGMSPLAQPLSQSFHASNPPTPHNPISPLSLSPPFITTEILECETQSERQDSPDQCVAQYLHLQKPLQKKERLHALSISSPINPHRAFPIPQTPPPFAHGDSIQNYSIYAPSALTTPSHTDSRAAIIDTVIDVLAILTPSPSPRCHSPMKKGFEETHYSSISKQAMGRNNGNVEMKTKQCLPSNLKNALDVHTAELRIDSKLKANDTGCEPEDKTSFTSNVVDAIPTAWGQSDIIQEAANIDNITITTNLNLKEVSEERTEEECVRQDDAGPGSGGFIDGPLLFQFEYDVEDENETF